MKFRDLGSKKRVVTEAGFEREQQAWGKLWLAFLMAF